MNEIWDVYGLDNYADAIMRGSHKKRENENVSRRQRSNSVIVYSCAATNTSLWCVALLYDEDVWPLSIHFWIFVFWLLFVVWTLLTIARNDTHMTVKTYWKLCNCWTHSMFNSNRANFQRNYRPWQAVAKFGTGTHAIWKCELKWLLITVRKESSSAE